VAFVLTNYVSVSGQVALHVAFVLTNDVSVSCQVTLHVTFILANDVSVSVSTWLLSLLMMYLFPEGGSPRDCRPC
jgi:hypothetical protein